MKLSKEEGIEYKSKWTPGPWIISWENDYNPRPIGINAPGDKDVPGRVGCIVRKNGFGFPTSKTARANAYLIAAAPEMHDALEAQSQAIDYLFEMLINLTKGWEKPFMPSTSIAWLAVMKAHHAIALARGESDNDDGIDGTGSEGRVAVDSDQSQADR